MFKKIVIGVIIFVNIFVCILNLFLFNLVGEEISILDNQVRVYRKSVDLETDALKKMLIDITKTTIENDKNIVKQTEKLYGIVKEMEKTIHTDTMQNVNNIKEANLLILNLTRGCVGSGTHIRIKNQDYILSVAHLIDAEEDSLWAKGDKDEYYFLSIVKYNRATDMALFKINKACPELPSLELSSETPEAGSEVVIIGNPAGETDIITEGIIAKVDSLHYTVTNLVFYGNSGGALLYKGRIIGVVSQLDCKIQPPVFVNYGKCIKIDIIKDFLKEFYI